MNMALCAQGLVNALFSARYKVDGDSMAPTLRHGQSVLVVRPRFSWNRIRRGDVVVLMRPGPPGGVYMKRIVGLPDEDVRVDDGRVYVGGALLEEAYATDVGGKSGEWFNGPDEIFVMGDNRAASDDSRSFGPVPRESVIGRVWFRCWPPAAWGFVRRV